MRATEDADLLRALDALLAAQQKPAIPASKRDALHAAASAVKERAKTLNEFLDLSHFAVTDRPLDYDEKAAQALDADAKKRLSGLTLHLRDASAWSKEALEEIVRGFAESEGLKLGKVAQPLRACLTGRGSSPGAFDVMLAIGRDETLARIDDLLKTAA